MKEKISKQGVQGQEQEQGKSQEQSQGQVESQEQEQGQGQDLQESTLEFERKTKEQQDKDQDNIHEEVKKQLYTELQSVNRLEASPKRKIKILSTPDNNAMVTVTINGYCYRIQRDTEVEVPEAVLKVLENSQESRPVFKDSKVAGYKKTSRFPFQVLG